VRWCCYCCRNRCCSRCLALGLRCSAVVTSEPRAAVRTSSELSQFSCFLLCGDPAPFLFFCVRVRVHVHVLYTLYFIPSLSIQYTVFLYTGAYCVLSSHAHTYVSGLAWESHVGRLGLLLRLCLRQRFWLRIGLGLGLGVGLGMGMGIGGS
jgi:hypothetical protein